MVIVPDKDDQNVFRVPSRGAVDDRNTIDSQLIGAHPDGSHRRLQSSRQVQLKKYLPGLKRPT